MRILNICILNSPIKPGGIKRHQVILKECANCVMKAGNLFPFFLYFFQSGIPIYVLYNPRQSGFVGTASMW